MKFSEILRSLIEEHDMTQKEMARQLNIAPSTLGSYVQGTREPDFSILKLIADYFGVITDYLLNHPAGNTVTFQEEELLQIFRGLSPEQRNICLEQCKVFIRINNREKRKKSS